MINNGKDIGFIHDIASLDKLRQKAVDGDENREKEALSAAAKQFESIFTTMLLKSMRDANSTFESGLMDSQNQQFYRQMMDEQMASELSSSGSLGLADMIVAQLSSGSVENPNAKAREVNFEAMMRKIDNIRQPKPVSSSVPIERSEIASSQPFDSPQSFVNTMKPYAERAARALGVDSSLILAQAALETGWGEKVIANTRGSSHNLFNIKADKRWTGDKVATQTLEYHQGIPVKENAAFRSYSSFEDSFNDYVQFLNDNPRYNSALRHQGNNESFIRGIHQAGYATDPEYADKVLKVKAQIEQM